MDGRTGKKAERHQMCRKQKQKKTNETRKKGLKSDTGMTICGPTYIDQASEQCSTIKCTQVAMLCASDYIWLGLTQ